MYQTKTEKGVNMNIVLKIREALENALEYFLETRDINDFISDINEIITNITLGVFE